jgi:glutamyl-tRNA reductase
VLKHLDGAGGATALLGVSPMTRRCATLLHAAGVPLTVVNRTLGTARELAQSVSARLLSLDEFRADPPPLAALVLAAGGSGAVLDGNALARLRLAAVSGGARPGSPLLVDFGVPPNVDAEAARRAGLERVGMEQLIETAQGQRLAQLLRLAPVRAAIDERLAHLRSELATRALGPRLQDLRVRFEEIAAAEVARALRHELRTLDEQQRAQLERLGCAVAHRLAHLPLAGLRAAAVHASADAVDAFFEAAKPGRAAAVKDES